MLSFLLNYEKIEHQQKFEPCCIFAFSKIVMLLKRQKRIAILSNGGKK